MLGNSTSDCPDGVGWINDYLGECVTTDVQIASAFIGLSSIGFWLVAQSPQIYMNFKNGNCESLALLFLVQWLLGDITNLVGAILTDQLPTQVYTAVYFCCIDAIMVSQYAYYKIRDHRLARKSLSRNGRTTSLHVALYMALFSISGISMFALRENLIGSQMGAEAVAAGGRSLLHITFTDTTQSKIGYALGCISATLYLCSRVPQILKNYHRKSVGGLSFAMFLMAVLGNVTYAMGVFMYNTDGDFLIDKLPWLVGSVGTVCFDCTIFIQFVLYGRHFDHDVEQTFKSHPTDEDEDVHHSDHHERSSLINPSSSRPPLIRTNSPLMVNVSKRSSAVA
ncbi:hypothetical protein CAOG_08934 [Capsaspora owczarzaki ATCC 30864]|uniref:PQ loop repeat family protein n=1 Tax=Capsaspora owczarzaki (strain ATCC 30864) TaxID=595528 RepID=A0A0D2X483_CAPO3|nr:hypothetical protein CAOG_08934 [Capsaspora owczarzaki ATCC 30864]KJE95609.1 hypothetical protein CAOG_008934 [Capsaspora owczarzaki ATCC 30864]|eukprot:XP_011270605.1 hypothetical protein CAOG_08934 [Capsaspora owczarzaki ATCC 30864]